MHDQSTTGGVTIITTGFSLIGVSSRPIWDSQIMYHLFRNTLPKIDNKGWKYLYEILDNSNYNWYDYQYIVVL